MSLFPSNKQDYLKSFFSKASGLIESVLGNVRPVEDVDVPIFTYAHNKFYLSGSTEVESVSREWKLEGKRGIVLAVMHSDCETGQWLTTEGVYLLTDVPLMDGQDLLPNGMYASVVSDVLIPEIKGGIDSEILFGLNVFYSRIPASK